MRRILLALIVAAFASGAQAQNYNATPGSGLVFGSKLVSSVNYPQIVFCDPATPSQCVAVNASGQITITNSSFTANAGTNLNTSLLALETGGNLAQVVTDFGSPGATACTTDTASCNLNQQMQRLAQRLTTLNTTLGSPFQAAASIGNTSFGISGTLPGYASIPAFKIDQTTPGTTNGVQVTNTNANGSATSANSAPVVIASDQAAVATKAASGAYVANAIADLAHGQGTMSASVPVVIASNQSTLPTNQTQYNSIAVVSNPCLTGTLSYIPISQATSTQVASLGGSSKKNYVCAVAIIASDAENISIVEGTGTVCATTPAAIFGGTTAANGMNGAANSGITFGNGAAPVAAGSLTSLNNVCILQSGTGRVAGSLVLAQQ